MMLDADKLAILRDAYRMASGEARRCGDEAFKALENAEQSANSDVFRKAAERALEAEEKWREAAERIREYLSAAFVEVVQKP